MDKAKLVMVWLTEFLQLVQQLRKLATVLTMSWVGQWKSRLNAGFS